MNLKLFITAMLFLLFIQFNSNAGFLGLGDNMKYKFTYDDAVNEAKQLSTQTYSQPETKLPDSISNMSYIDWTSIQFQYKDELWMNDNLNFRLSFFPLGTPLYTKPIDINIVTDKDIKKAVFNKDYFNFFEKVMYLKKDMPDNAGYAGFKLAHKSEKGFPEFAVFLGSNYFRMVPDDATFGLSNRGIAINIGLEDTKEEFPTFEKFWILKPEEGDDNITIYAIMNGPSVVGAYSFDIFPGTNAKIKVKSTIFMRNSVKVLGLSPMTSMFWFGEYTEYNFYDYRPQVHNSEGLLIADKNNTFWQPLTNYPDYKMLTSDIHTDRLNYFGLFQRTRDYNEYLDPNVKYGINTNAWITPDNDWGKGSLRLFQLQSKKEWIDNINVYWIPDLQPKEKEAYQFDYTIYYSLKEPVDTYMKVKFTNIGIDQLDANNTIFLVSFENDKNYDEDSVKNMKINLEVPNGVEIIRPPTLQVIPYNNTLAAMFTLNGKKLENTDDPYIIKCSISNNDKKISETWLYQWYPPNVNP